MPRRANGTLGLGAGGAGVTVGMPDDDPNKQRRYALYPEQDRAKKFQQCRLEAPDMLRRLRELPPADGTLDQAQELLTGFYSVWRPFRIRVTKCDQRDWLAKTIYSTDGWKNYERLKKQSTRYRKWKAKDNKERWLAMSEPERERRRRQQREAAKDRWFDVDRCFQLADRCRKHDPKAKQVTYGPVIRLVKKHATPQFSEQYILSGVRLALACHRLDPRDPEARKDFEGELKWCCVPGLDQASRDRAEKDKQFWRLVWAKYWKVDTPTF